MKTPSAGRTLLSIFSAVLFMLFLSTLYPGIANTDVIQEQPLVTLNDIQEGALAVKDPLTGRYRLLPTLHTDVSIRIDGMVSNAVVEQTFCNDSAEPIEAVYVFPLPTDAAVYDMKMLVGDRYIQGEIQEKAEARKTYETARKSGKRASLTEQQRPNIFTNTIANIMPGDTMAVRLEYVDRLGYEQGRFRLRFPMVVAPRFISGHNVTGYSRTGWALDTDIVPDASKITPPICAVGERSGNRISLSLSLHPGLPIKQIESSSHSIIVDHTDTGEYEIRLRNLETIPNKDFLLEYSVERSRELSAALFTTTSQGSDYFMLMAMPPEEIEETHRIAKEILFVIDVSGSMSGTSIIQAREGLSEALNRLASDDYFNIIAFNNSFRAFRPVPIQATEENVSVGLKFTQSLVADGGTAAFPAVEHALMMPSHSNAIRLIIFLTDGCVGNESQLMGLLDSRLGDSRLFTVGIGSAPNAHLMEKLAQFGRGTFTYISRLQDVQSQIGGLYSRIENPVLTDIYAQFPGEATIYPRILPDLFQHDPLLLFGKIDNLEGSQLVIGGKIGERPFQMVSQISLQGGQRNPAISTLWARQKIADLMDAYRLGQRELKSEIIEVAIEHNLLTRFTSFVAVEHKIVNPEKHPSLAVIPTDMPEGWLLGSQSGSNAAMIRTPRTATQMPLAVTIGCLMILAGAILHFSFGIRRQT